jgi:hypothetical protein
VTTEGGYLLAPPQEVIRHHPIVAAQVDRDHGARVDVACAGEPRHEAVIDSAVRIEEEKPALAVLRQFRMSWRMRYSRNFDLPLPVEPLPVEPVT